MIAHQAIGTAAPVKALTHGLQGHREGMAIGIVFINGLASVAATRDMIGRTGRLNAKGLAILAGYIHDSRPDPNSPKSRI